jgi:chromosome segregation protein
LYLKRLEMIGFKSFAEKTRLEFTPGMMAIVGPNGCGKSNIADAIRWVLGEQSPKAMRGSKMEDVIFSGTDALKAQNVAEVSLTLADCETVLGTDYHEITVTRRVHRSGEGEYLINRAVCRLKDIHRLFMDTGIGTNSYSLLEQGRIDRILSSRPEDRRSVFEEASGITKYKADRKEALRKLEQTEANLLRLADVIREIKRQIISLQRQAGKARRFQSLQERLRDLDLFNARNRLSELESALNTLELRRASLLEREEAAHADLQERESHMVRLREELEGVDHTLEETRESLMQTRSDRDRALETLRINEDRIRELTAISERDSRDAETARESLERQRTRAVELAVEKGRADADACESNRRLDTCSGELRTLETGVDQAERSLHQLRLDQIELERRLSTLQGELTQLDARDRETTIRRERLAAEKAQLEHSLEQFTERNRIEVERIHSLRADTAGKTQQLETATRVREENISATEELRQTLADLRAQAAARKAEGDTLQRSEAASEGYASGARAILELARTGTDTGILGPLAGHVTADPGYEAAVHSVLRPWMDAILVADRATALRLLSQMDARKDGSASLFVADAPEVPADAQGLPGDPLLPHVRISEAARRAVSSLLARVRVVDSLDAAPDLSSGLFVTRSGQIAHEGRFERWAAEAEAANPFARHGLMELCGRELKRLQTEGALREEELRLARLQEGDLETELTSTRARLDAARRELAEAEGENRVLDREMQKANQRVETVTYELQALIAQTSTGDDSRRAILTGIEDTHGRQSEARNAIASQTEALRSLNQKRAEAVHVFTEARIEASDRQRDVRELEHQIGIGTARITELEDAIRERAEGAVQYRARIENLQRDNAAARDSLEPCENEIQLLESRLQEIRGQREQRQTAIGELDAGIRSSREALDAVREDRGRADVEWTEQRMRRQNLVDRTAADYRITVEDLSKAGRPDWGEETPDLADREAVETALAELRARIQAIGPVNLVAIEEHQELEERHTFLTTQQDDLVRAKQHLTDLIRRINLTTTEMFSETFQKVNACFQEMFVKLFGGGSAKLVLVDEGDVLESGIEIIARPPGKRLQSVSLLSGGERTMTAVALLFSLYRVKPSPFCVLDELDAALDDANIGRFVRVVQDFLKNSQFIVITHNRQTIAAAESLFGVTMEKHGVSKIISVRFQPGVNAALEPAAPAASPTPATDPKPIPAG